MITTTSHSSPTEEATLVSVHVDPPSRIRLPAGETVESITRRGMDMEAAGATTDDISEALHMHAQTYYRLKHIVSLANDEGLKPDQRAIAQAALASVRNGGSVKSAFATIKHIAEAKYGTKRGPGGIDRRFAKRMAKAKQVIINISAACAGLPLVDVPAGIPTDERKEWLAELDGAIAYLRRFRHHVQEV